MLLYFLSLLEIRAKITTTITHLQKKILLNYPPSPPKKFSYKIDVNKTSELKECNICPCWYFLNKRFKGELHSNYIFLHFALIGLEWDSITLSTMINIFFLLKLTFQQHLHKIYIYIYIYIYMAFYLLT